VPAVSVDTCTEGETTAGRLCKPRQRTQMTPLYYMRSRHYIASVLSLAI